MSAFSDAHVPPAGRAISGRHRHRHRFPGQRVVRLRNHAEESAQPHDGGYHLAAIGRDAGRRSGGTYTLGVWGSGEAWRPIVGATGIGACLFLLARLWLAGKSALADAAWPRPGSGANRLEARGHRGAASSCATREQGAGRVSAAVLEALSHAHLIGIGAVVSDGHCNLWRRTFYSGDPRRDPYFFQHGRAIVGRISPMRKGRLRSICFCYSAF